MVSDDVARTDARLLDADGSLQGAADPEFEARARRLSRELLILDSHIDVPHRLAEGGWEDLSRRTDGGDFDYPRAIAGGLTVAFLAVFVPAKFQNTGRATPYADSLIDDVEALEQRWPDKFRIIREPVCVEELPRGTIGLALGLENGEPIDGDLANLEHFRERGIRYVTLTHFKNNHICDSSFDDEILWQGLSPFGRELVSEMNRLGVMVDISHVSDAAADEILERTTQPVIASHSSARAFTPGFERNLSDRLIERLAASGGVIQINFGSAFLTQQSNREWKAVWDAALGHAAANELDLDGPEMLAWMDAYRLANAPVLATVDDVVAHIEHVISLVGVEHVGLGSDFDGVGPTTPEGLKDVSEYPNLIRALLARGHSESDIQKICGANLMRVWSQVAAAS